MCKRCHAFRLEALIASSLPNACPSAELIHQMCPLQLDKLFGALRVSWVAAPRFLAIIDLRNPDPFRHMPDSISQARISDTYFGPTIESLSDTGSSASTCGSSPRLAEVQRLTARLVEGLSLHDSSRVDALLAAVRELRKDKINLRMPENQAIRVEKLGLTDIYVASRTPHRVVLAISRVIQNPFLFEDEEIIVDYLRANA